MIPADAITAWSVDHPWSTRAQVEQDLLLSRAICAIAEDEYLGQELVFRGGTALHKLHLERPWRYSEDLDYVRSSGTGIAALTRALTRLGESLDFTVRTRVSEHPKVYWRATSVDETPIRIKIEVNTHERSPALPLMHVEHGVSSAWWTGVGSVQTFHPAELVATKIRALYQRSKGRDLFDLWLALEHLHLDPEEVLGAFGPYRPAGLTAQRAIDNLAEKVRDPLFRSDIAVLVAQLPDGYTVDGAAELVTAQLLARLP